MSEDPITLNIVCINRLELTLTKNFKNNTLNGLSFSIDCEHQNATMARINKRLKDKGITEGSYMCVTAPMKEIKEKMKIACR